MLKPSSEYGEYHQADAVMTSTRGQVFAAEALQGTCFTYGCFVGVTVATKMNELPGPAKICPFAVQALREVQQTAICPVCHNFCHKMLMHGI